MLQRATRVCVKYAESYVPDPYLYAVILTFITAIAAEILTKSGPIAIVNSWYHGLFSILAFSMQMALVLLSGMTLASAPAIRKLLVQLASFPESQFGAAVLVFLVSALCSWLNWGFGLVIGTLIAREIAKRLKNIDFGFLVASAYMGWMVWSSGLSSSIALATATPGSALNIIQKITGEVPGLSQTIFAAYNLVPTVLFIVIMPIALYFMAPKPEHMKTIDPEVLIRQDEIEKSSDSRITFATILENSWLIIVVLFLMGLAYEANRLITTGLSLDINDIIFYATWLGLILHWRPIHYVRAFNKSATTVGPIILQYPIYGGIMGMMVGTGLAGVIAQSFVAISGQHTLPFWAFLSSNIISIFVPSGGGHWAVQGPFIVPAAVKLHAQTPMTAMATAMGEQVADMIQPFWTLPVLAIAGLGIKDIMGYCMITFLIGFCVYGGALLFFG